MYRIDDTNRFEFSYFAESVNTGVLLIDIFVDSESAAQGPFRLSVLPRDCFRLTGDSLKTPDAVGNCVCQNGSASVGFGNCIDSTQLAVVIVVPLIWIALFTWCGVRYVRKKRGAARSRWEVKYDELDIPRPTIALGHGTFGAVIEARYRGAPVALKRALPRARSRVERTRGAFPDGLFDDTEMVPRKLGDATSTERSLHQSFEQEMQFLSQLRHPSKSRNSRILLTLLSFRSGNNPWWRVARCDTGDVVCT